MKQDQNNQSNIVIRSNKGKKVYVIIALLAMIAIGVFVKQSIIKTEQADEVSKMLQTYGLQQSSVVEIVSYFDRVVDESLMAGISGSELKLYDQEKEYTLDLPDDVFYLSFAPYQYQTHPCLNHNLTTCRGEMKNEDFDVVVVDADGNERLNTTMTSMDNGFIGLWLPKNIEAKLEVKYGTKSAAYDISTYEDSNTCLTTPIKLS